MCQVTTMTRTNQNIHITILGLGLELARNGGSCGGISLKRGRSISSA